MSAPSEPRRLFEDEAHRPLARALGVVRQDQPSPEQIEALVLAVERAAVLTVVAATTKTFATGSKLALIKGGAALCVVGVVGVCSWVALHHTDPVVHPRTPRVVSVVPALEVEAPPSATPTNPPVVDARPRDLAAAPNPVAPKAVPTHEPAIAPPIVAPLDASHAPALARGTTARAPRRAVSSTSATHEATRDAPPIAPAQSTASRARPNTTASEAATPASGEVELLSAAQRALRRTPSQALTLAHEHARRYPDGAFAEERDAVEIEALALLGRIDDARARVNAFMHDYPSSPHRRRLVQLLGTAR
jgi:hypothetical protein